ncbi:MAG: transcriptional repressor [Elusimicrobia bacterium]|nr:transcriptional repressor [Elusimicrobiota bacterium]MDE2313694.1 transcriptional repressor [Elusimicrobiota bacterium]
MRPPDFARMLRRSGGRATPGRLRLMRALWKEPAPVTAARLQKSLGRTLNLATLYRALDALAGVGVVRRVDFRHGHAHYELAAPARAHHHHLACTGCGAVEDVSCTLRPRLKRASAFSAITDHAMEYFGLCKACGARGAERVSRTRTEAME